jgi:hypothetical protein
LKAFHVLRYDWHPWQSHGTLACWSSKLREIAH